MCRRAYSRCNSGHYFLGDCCPFDGWSSPASRELTAAVKRLARSGRPLSLDELRKHGVSERTIARTIIIEFGAEASVFDAINPASLFVKEETIPLTELGANFT
jgi:hypothetical protein